MSAAIALFAGRLLARCARAALRASVPAPARDTGLPSPWILGVAPGLAPARRGGFSISRKINATNVFHIENATLDPTFLFLMINNEYV